MTKVSIWISVLLISMVWGCSEGTKDGHEFTRRERIELQQYYVAGERLYAQHCGNCHMPEGEGLGRLIPPLKGTDFMERDSLLACIIKNGLSGEIEVNGVVYNQPMPGIPQLTNIEIAQITTYLYKEFFDKDVLLKPSAIEQMLSECEP